jgi:signal transduction histidine kinase
MVDESRRGLTIMRSNRRDVFAVERASLEAGMHAVTPRVVVALLALRTVRSAAKRASRQRAILARVSAAAAAAERRRVAWDLHDGIAQDLALIAAYGDQITAAMGDGHAVVMAAQRALALSQTTIAELSDPPGATPQQSLGALGRELSDRFGIAVAVDAPLPGQLTPLARHHMSRIVREAVTNAVRHGRARNVAVTLARAERGVALQVVDDGHAAGEGDGTPAGEGFGVRSMRERAAALGGVLDLRRSPRGGTELEVLVP